jgi:hypothetical protein
MAFADRDMLLNYFVHIAALPSTADEPGRFADRATQCAVLLVIKVRGNLFGPKSFGYSGIVMSASMARCG